MKCSVFDVYLSFSAGITWLCFTTRDIFGAVSTAYPFGSLESFLLNMLSVIVKPVCEVLRLPLVVDFPLDFVRFPSQSLNFNSFWAAFISSTHASCPGLIPIFGTSKSSFSSAWMGANAESARDIPICPWCILKKEKNNDYVNFIWRCGLLIEMCTLVGWNFLESNRQHKMFLSFAKK